MQFYTLVLPSFRRGCLKRHLARQHRYNTSWYFFVNPPICGSPSFSCLSPCTPTMYLPPPTCRYNTSAVFIARNHNHRALSRGEMSIPKNLPSTVPFICICIFFFYVKIQHYLNRISSIDLRVTLACTRSRSNKCSYTAAIHTNVWTPQWRHKNDCLEHRGHQLIFLESRIRNLWHFRRL